MKEKTLRVSVGGFGAIGRTVAAALDAGIPGLELAAVSARDTGRARAHMAAHFGTPSEVRPLECLSDGVDVVVECCPAHLFETVALPALEAGKILVVASTGALLHNRHLEAVALRTGGRILVPSGALAGLDAVQAAALGRIDSITLVTRKPPASLKGAPAIAQMGLDLDALTEPVCCYAGPVEDAIAGFPANVNVAATLGFAGIGAADTRLEVWADPGVTRNIHAVTVISDSATISVQIEGMPSPDNPRTSRITPLSVISTLRRLTAPLVIGA
ncbi:aspartate dehydrogenase [Palleronia sp. LCG004]|uniref:aspartate dehydrogenase n=1 Tax=Palleronia sp. LCG004 TaxID=3079304 RepID=UPI002941C357|nr:aspartate dehydrogenase [Palleronia sp. LCG004]WOI58305.1 aspartate dehydrogenase [Palleronia sp. LCG004]